MLAELIARFRAHPDGEQQQADLGVALVRAGNVVGLQEMFNFIHQSGHCGLECARMIGQGLALRESGLLLRLMERYDRECPFRGPLVAALGYAHALDYNLDAAVAAIREGLHWVSLVQAQIPNERLSDLRYTQLVKSAFLFERSDWMADAPVPPPSLEVLHPGCSEGGFACVAAADSRYFVTYAPDYLADLAATMGAAADPVLVVVDPDAEALACAAELAQRHPNAAILINSYGGSKLVEYCSGARFVVAAEMLRRLNRPTIFLDIDTCFAPGCGDIFAHIAEFPLISQHRDVAPPYLIAEACVVGAHPGGRGDRFFTDAARYFLAKLQEDGPLWHVDQVALHRALCLERQRGTPSADLGKVFQGGIDLPGYFKKPHELDYKGRAVIRTDVITDREYSIAPDGKPVFPPATRPTG